ncbi:hypothetical protein BY996DRAFT_8447967 [Phakopsora pachyrhizi]|nr:hypothetical protein BY996DRAFT_8447967 [Phakopsora pachyrhizi]
MNDMVETLEDLSISFSGFNINKDGKHRPGPSRTNHMPQRGWFPLLKFTVQQLIRQHIATLLGLKDGGLPIPHDENNQSQMDVDDEEHDSDGDPCYPYPRGPGHTNATPQTLSIMWRMMNEAGVKSFRPDFSQPCNSPDNNFRECCSDDESDKEVVQPIQSSYIKQKLKECVACKLPWRYPRVTRLMVALDKIKLKESESSSRGSSGPAPRLRHEVEFPPISQLQPPSQIHKCCFN